MNLAGGCVCCDTKEDLSWGIAQLVRDYKSDVIILECSGMADPAEVIDGVTDLYTARLTRLEKVIALLHPIPTDRESTGGFVTRQAIRCADELILNKKDLYIAGHWERFKATTVDQNPYARIWETSHARVDPSSLLEPMTRMSPASTVNVEFGVPRSSTTSPRASYHPSHDSSAARPVRLCTIPALDGLPELERAKGTFAKDQNSRISICPARPCPITPMRCS
jgi:G3E family GTPase